MVQDFILLKIKKLFIQTIYTHNPFKLFTVIAISISNSNDKYLKTIENLDILTPDENKYEKIIDELVNNSNRVYKDLIKKLEDIEIEMDAFSYFYNAEKEQYDDSGSLINPIGNNTSIYTKGFLEGHEILFVCLYNYDMNPNEDPNTNYEYLFKKSPTSYYYFNQCAEYYKVKVTLVLNYKDAIEELTTPWDKDPEKCKYYATWIICGPPYPMLPPLYDSQGNLLPNNQQSNPYLLGLPNALIIFTSGNLSLIHLVLELISNPSFGVSYTTTYNSSTSFNAVPIKNSCPL